MVANALLFFVPSIGAQSQHVIVDKAGAAERLGKILFLLCGWIKPKTICAFDFHLLTIHDIIRLCEVIILDCANGRFQAREAQCFKDCGAFSIRHKIPQEGVRCEGAKLASTSLRQNLSKHGLRTDCRRWRIGSRPPSDRIPAKAGDFGFSQYAKRNVQPTTSTRSTGHCKTILRRSAMDTNLFCSFSGRRTVGDNQEVRRGTTSVLTGRFASALYLPGLKSGVSREL